SSCACCSSRSATTSILCRSRSPACERRKKNSKRPIHAAPATTNRVLRIGGPTLAGFRQASQRSAHHVAARGLRGIHRLVGRLEEIVQVARLRRALGAAEADRHATLEALALD